MKNYTLIATLVFSFALLSGCRKKNENNYVVNFKTLRQNQKPAEGFRVDAWVEGKSEPRTLITNAEGMAPFTDLPKPDVQHHLNTVLHYYTGKADQERSIDYPFIPSDAERLKDTQYIPNNATPGPQ